MNYQGHVPRNQVPKAIRGFFSSFKDDDRLWRLSACDVRTFKAKSIHLDMDLLDQRVNSSLQSARDLFCKPDTQILLSAFHIVNKGDHQDKFEFGKMISFRFGTSASALKELPLHVVESEGNDSGQVFKLQTKSNAAYNLQ